MSVNQQHDKNHVPNYANGSIRTKYLPVRK